MYSGTTFRKDSGRIIGVHQKIDRASRRHLDSIVPKSFGFPGIRSILHFEGKNGPDGIKLKSPNKDELRHFINPSDSSDRDILDIINGHVMNLTKALDNRDEIKASFEAAWLAHAVVDGLTPAHHHKPSDQERKSLLDIGRRFLSKNSKETIQEMNKRKALVKKWEYWGTRGVMSHIMFEWGVASVIAPDNFDNCGPTDYDIEQLKKRGFEEVFLDAVQIVDRMRMFEEYKKTGWTHQLGVKTRRELLPLIIKTVTLAWYQAIISSKRYNK
jgi:hypothetical protein